MSRPTSLGDRLRAFIDPEAYAISIGDPAFASYIRTWMEAFGWDTFIGLQQPAFYRAVSLISQTIAGLPLRTFRTKDDGSREEASSFLSTNPAGPYAIPPFNFWEQAISWFLMMGEVGLLHIMNEGDALIGLLPIMPINYTVRYSGFDKEFAVNFGSSGQRRYTSDSEILADGSTRPGGFTQVMGLTQDGLRGLSPLTLFRRQHDLARAQDEAAKKAMTSGMLVGGLAAAREEIDEDDAKAIKAGLDSKVTGPENANALAFVNKNIDFKPWQQANVDLTYVAGREFSVTEVSRMFGVPPFLLNQVEKSTSWGTGIAEQAQSMHKYTFSPITSRFESVLSRLLPQPRFIEWDYKGLLQGTPAEEIALLLQQTGKPFMTVNEARKILNLQPVRGGDDLDVPASESSSPGAAQQQDAQQESATTIPAGSNGHG